MWFRRLFRRRRPPPSVLLPSLERLAELIERVVELLDQVAAGPLREPAQSQSSAPPPNPGPNPPAAVESHVLLVSSPDGYRLLNGKGGPPARGDLLDVEGDRFTVIRLGPSPLPGDRRRCVCLERQEPRTVDRTFDR
jgi:hypothetical protein